MENKIINEVELKKHHSHQIQIRSQKDIFFIWMLLMFISVIAAHFVLNFIPGSPTGFVTAAESPGTNTTILLGAIMVVCITILITALIYTGVTKKDY